jgi:hypothetical protein
VPTLAFCPHPPLLAAGSTVGQVDEVQAVRAAAVDVVQRLVASGPSAVLVVGPGAPRHDLDESVGGSLRPHGVDVDAGGDDQVLGLAHTVGAWLLDQAGWDGPRRYTGSLDVDDLDAEVAVLVMADGSATRTERAPGHLDERSGPFDATVAAALAEGDADALAGVDLELAETLWCQGATTWRDVADAVSARVHARGSDVEAELLLDEAPLGVGWFVAQWHVA